MFDGLAGRRPGRVALVLAGVGLLVAAGLARSWLLTSSSSDTSGTDDDLFGIASGHRR